MAGRMFGSVGRNVVVGEEEGEVWGGGMGGRALCPGSAGEFNWEDWEGGPGWGVGCGWVSLRLFKEWWWEMWSRRVDEGSRGGVGCLPWHRGCSWKVGK